MVEVCVDMYQSVNQVAQSVMQEYRRQKDWMTLGGKDFRLHRERQE